MVNDGGPAFPGEWSKGADYHEKLPWVGMSLRDWFAGNVAVNQMQLNSHNINSYQAKYTAEWAYMVADAMLEARKRGV